MSEEKRNILKTASARWSRFAVLASASAEENVPSYPYLPDGWQLAFGIGISGCSKPESPPLNIHELRRYADSLGHAIEHRRKRRTFT
jgi:hypothetical protein